MKIFAYIAVAAVAVMLIVSFLSGVFDTVAMSIQKAGPYNLIYKKHKGPYSGIRIILNDVYKYAVKEKKGRVRQGFGIFYDDPSGVPPDSLRSIAGVITDSLHEVSDPYKSAFFPETESVVGVFPVRSFLSYTSGTLKFYPRLKNYLSENKLKLSGPVLEIYDSAEKVIIYVAPVNDGPSPAPSFGN